MNKIKLLLSVMIFVNILTFTREINLEEIKKTTLKVSKIENGINYLDLNKDGNKDMVIDGYRSNLNAHAFEVLSFYIYQPELEKYGIIAIGNSEKEKYEIFVSNGDEEVIPQGVRIAEIKGEKNLVIVYAKLINSKAESSKVKFIFYGINYDQDEKRYILDVKYEKNSNNEYSDVNEAFKMELGY